MNADQLAAEYERGYRDGGYQATGGLSIQPTQPTLKMRRAAHSSEQSADTKRLDWLPAGARSLDQVVSLGDYVLATKYADADPQDPWRVGFVVRVIDTLRRGKTYIIGEQDGTWSDFREYNHVRKITAQEGKEWIEANGEVCDGGA